CVKAACLGAADLGIKTYLVKDATEGVSAKAKAQALRLLKQKGITLVTTNTVIELLPKNF
ncbi:MAG: isochorismatase family protein, partial [Candidatus Omnitrophota bacterium]